MFNFKIIFTQLFILINNFYFLIYKKTNKKNKKNTIINII